MSLLERCLCVDQHLNRSKRAAAFKADVSALLDTDRVPRALACALYSAATVAASLQELRGGCRDHTRAWEIYGAGALLAEGPAAGAGAGSRGGGGGKRQEQELQLLPLMLPVTCTPMLAEDVLRAHLFKNSEAHRCGHQTPGTRHETAKVGCEGRGSTCTHQ